MSKSKEAQKMLRPKSRKKFAGKLKAAIKEAKRTKSDVNIRVKVSKKR